MTFDPTWLLLSLIPGGVGFVLVTYGRKQDRLPHLIAGLLFIVYPYFATGIVSLLAIGAAIGAGLWYAVKVAGY